MYRFTFAIAVLSVAASSSCTPFRRAKVPTPPPMIAAPPTKPPSPVENPQVPPPPKVEQATVPSVAPTVSTQIPAKPPLPQAKVVNKRPKRQGAKPAAMVATAPPPVVETPAVTPTPPPVEAAPVLSPMLSAVQQEAFNKAIDAGVQQTEAGLASVSAKPLNQTQQANAERARSFIAQAQQVRGSDVVTAKSLVDRAALLTQALVAEVR